MNLLIVFHDDEFYRYIIPVPVIKHFIAGVEERGNYVGFCSLGLSCQSTENVQLREHFHMHPGLTGVMVSKINPLSNAHKVLKKDDILLSFDGVPIANDGTGKVLSLICGIGDGIQMSCNGLLHFFFVFGEA